MSPGHAGLVLVHIVLLVYWLGADLGVFYASGFIIDSRLSLESRQAIRKISHFIDLFPRMCLVLTLPVGAMLIQSAGYAEIPAPALAALWLFALAWFVLVLRIYGGVTPFWMRIDYGIRFAVIAATAGAAFLVEPFWLSAKLFLYAVIVLLGLGIRVTFKPFAAAMARMTSEGPTPELEAALRRGMRNVRPVVLGLWFLLVVEAFLGLSKLHGA